MQEGRTALDEARRRDWHACIRWIEEVVQGMCGSQGRHSHALINESVRANTMVTLRVRLSISVWVWVYDGEGVSESQTDVTPSSPLHPNHFPHQSHPTLTLTVALTRPHHHPYHSRHEPLPHRSSAPP